MVDAVLLEKLRAEFPNSTESTLMSRAEIRVLDDATVLAVARSPQACVFWSPQMRSFMDAHPTANPSWVTNAHAEEASLRGLIDDDELNRMYDK